MGAPQKVDLDLKRGPLRRMEALGARGRAKPTMITVKRVEDQSSQRFPREAGDPRLKVKAYMVAIDQP